jgi:hypothetical protein
MKRCFKCGEIKPLIEFYAHQQMKDGHLGKCKDCAKLDAKLYREQSDNPRIYDLLRAKKPERKAKILEGQKRRRAKCPEKERAYNKVRHAIKSGKLIRQLCFCGNSAQAHHDDYSKPLDVKWLCQKHHDQRHKELGWG